jgi:hypothetical protein
MFQLIKEILSGFGQRIRLENHLQLQRSGHVRPKQIKLEIAHIFKDIEDQLEDPRLRKEYDSIKLTLPGEVEAKAAT